MDGIARTPVWHIWDGRSDGFHTLINYHKLDHAALQKLTYSYLGNWIQHQSDDAKADKPAPPNVSAPLVPFRRSLPLYSKGRRPSISSSAGSPSKTGSRAGIPTSTMASAKTSDPSCWQVTSASEVRAYSVLSPLLSKTKTEAPNQPAQNPIIPGSGAKMNPGLTLPVARNLSAIAGTMFISHWPGRKRQNEKKRDDMILPHLLKTNMNLGRVVTF